MKQTHFETKLQELKGYLNNNYFLRIKKEQLETLNIEVPKLIYDEYLKILSEGDKQRIERMGYRNAKKCNELKYFAIICMAKAQKHEEIYDKLGSELFDTLFDRFPRK